mmetsp:Transcript_12416/g.30123  ORF Transcript_12416/g.30123 Transcript_12416/m.30123 type:complete len:232 (-) Transcript_12416:1162-1857(-)
MSTSGSGGVAGTPSQSRDSVPQLEIHCVCFLLSMPFTGANPCPCWPQVRNPALSGTDHLSRLLQLRSEKNCTSRTRHPFTMGSLLCTSHWLIGWHPRQLSGLRHVVKSNSACSSASVCARLVSVGDPDFADGPDVRCRSYAVAAPAAAGGPTSKGFDRPVFVLVLDAAGDVCRLCESTLPTTSAFVFLSGGVEDGPDEFESVCSVLLLRLLLSCLPPAAPAPSSLTRSTLL